MHTYFLYELAKMFSQVGLRNVSLRVKGRSVYEIN